jgi:hypothetical protein
VLALAKKANVTALAITDHDITSGISEAKAAAQHLGIEVIPGVEVSSYDGRSELHILGYYVECDDSLFMSRLASLRASRHRRNPLIIERLREAGLDVTYDEVRALAGTESVGRPHIAQLLMRKKYVASAKEGRLCRPGTAYAGRSDSMDSRGQGRRRVGASHMGERHGRRTPLLPHRTQGGRPRRSRGALQYAQQISNGQLPGIDTTSRLARDRRQRLSWDYEAGR